MDRGAAGAATQLQLSLPTPPAPTRPLLHRLPFLPQLPLLKARWKQVLFGAIFQYVHGIFTQLAHRMHQPLEEPLGDIGFRYLPVRRAGIRQSMVRSTLPPRPTPSPAQSLVTGSISALHCSALHWFPAFLGDICAHAASMQELGLENAWVSESIFWCLFIPFILWTFSPFVTARKRFYTAVLYARLLMVLVGEQRGREEQQAALLAVQPKMQ